jgi:hypothetical protein
MKLGTYHTNKTKHKMRVTKLGKQPSVLTRERMAKSHTSLKYKVKDVCGKGHNISKVGRYKDYSCKECKKNLTPAMKAKRKIKYGLEYQNTWNKLNPTKRKEYALKSLYGLTLEQFKLLSREQNFRCKLCNRKRKLVIDHNHKTNKVRGLLCFQCNIMLGLLRDSRRVALRIAEYLND